MPNSYKYFIVFAETIMIELKIMEDSHKILKEVIDKVGAKEIAYRLNVSAGLVYKWCEQSKTGCDQTTPSGAKNPLDRIRDIYETTKDPALINWICQLADGFFVENSQKKPIDIEQSVMGIIQKIIKEFSETLEAISQSYHDDQKIDLQEAKLIRKEWEELKMIGEKFVSACEKGQYF